MPRAGHISAYQQKVIDSQDAQPMVSRCFCGREFTGTAKKCRESMRRHRRAKHPELPVRPTSATALMMRWRKEQAAEKARQKRLAKIAGGRTRA